MERHPNFQEVEKQCEDLRVRLKEDKEKLSQQSLNADKVSAMIDEASKQNHTKRDELRFVAVVVHRILYHLNHDDAAHEVLRDMRSFCKDAIMKEDKMNKDRSAVLDELQREKTPTARKTKSVEPGNSQVRSSFGLVREDCCLLVAS